MNILPQHFDILGVGFFILLLIFLERLRRKEIFSKGSGDYNFLLIILAMSIFGLAVDVCVVYTYFLSKI